ncbi:nucleotidyltransferase family protein [Alteromonas sp. CYL-A6]|uniref:nucleotidyltransferase family protein n=1 Tax=Alteromonas nitratireducens TaxID=3390813 RepID=UPI0034B6AE8C
MSYRSDSARLSALLRADPFRMRCLRAVRALKLNDAFIAAGFVRNAIWDACHGYDEPTPLNDIDVVYFDRRDCSEARDAALTEQLQSQVPDVVWEVKNQARMHAKHNHSPYTNTTEALRHWVEIPTCVGVRLEEDDSLTVTAPFGLAHNFSLNVAINPDFPRPYVFRQRIASKQWLLRWPRLRVCD